jgi:3-oxoadipate enol-lactonase
MTVTRLLWISLLLLGARSAVAQEGVQSGYVHVDGARLYYEQAGSGMPVVMIHGGYLDHHMWDDDFDLVAEHYRAIRYDVRAHGQSSSDSVPFADHDDLRHLLDTLAVPRAVIVGLSMGGQIAIDFALANPDRVAGLVLVGSGLSGFEPKSDQIARYIQELRAAVPRGFPAIYEVFTRWFCDGPYRQPSEVDSVVRHRMFEMLAGSEQRWRYSGLERPLNPPALGRLGEIHVPTLVVVGSLDVRDIHHIADLIVENVPGAKRVEIPGVAHMVNMEKPAAFNRVLMGFLGQIKAE